MGQLDNGLGNAGYHNLWFLLVGDKAYHYLLPDLLLLDVSVGFQVRNLLYTVTSLASRLPDSLYRIY